MDGEIASDWSGSRRNARPSNEADDDLIDIAAAEKISGLSRSTIYRKIADPEDDFPRPVALSRRRRKFIRGELKAWRDRRIANRNAATQQSVA
jgi:predicted DNA-binding transcriptional regulator AlpA